MKRDSSGQLAHYHILGQAGTSFLTALVQWLRNELKFWTKHIQGIAEMSKKGLDGRFKEDEMSRECVHNFGQKV